MPLTTVYASLRDFSSALAGNHTLLCADIGNGVGTKIFPLLEQGLRTL